MAEPSTTSLNMLKHEAIKGILANAITTGKYKAGDRLPSIRELVERHSVSVTPVFRAISELTSDGLIRRIPGRRGLFVVPAREIRPPQKLNAVAMVYEGAQYQSDGGASKLISQLLVESFTEAARGPKIQVRAYPHRPVSIDREDTELLEILTGFKVVVFSDATYLHWTKYLQSCGCRVLFIPGGGTVWPGVNSIKKDLFGGIQDLLEYLLQLGHQRISFLNAASSPAVKLQAYVRVMARAGHRIDVLQTDSGYHIDAYRATRELFAQRHANQRPTAILADNDTQAIGVIDALTELGLRIPQDVSVAGIDNRPEAAVTKPPLTTTGPDYSTIVSMAMNWVTQVLAGDTPPDVDVCVPYKLFVRGSTAAPARQDAAAGVE